MGSEAYSFKTLTFQVMVAQITVRFFSNTFLGCYIQTVFQVDTVCHESTKVLGAQCHLKWVGVV